MDIAFRSRKLKKIFDSESELRRAHGKLLARKIMLRLAVLKAASNLSLVPTQPPNRRHLLKGGRNRQFAVDLDQSYRLVFRPDHDPIMLTEDGGIDLTQVTAITILEVVDYH